MLERIFEDYLHYRRNTAHYCQMKERLPYMREPKLNEERRNALQNMIGWCQQNSLDPRWFLYSLFHARKWIAAPRWDQLVPGTNKTAKKAIARYKALNRAPLFLQRVDAELQASQENNYDPNRDISTTTENIKRNYLAVYDTDRCIAEMQTTTLGYHPKSLVCARCPVAKKCAEMLQATVPFDILALRRGEITTDQAKRVAGRFYAEQQRW